MTIPQILQFLHEVEQLKKELRHSRLSDGRQESVAEHTRRMSLMAILLAPHLSKSVDMLHVLKMVIVHDINEGYVGDIPSFASNHGQLANNEEKNMADLVSRFPGATMDEIADLWHEYEEQSTHESHFVKALDKIEVRIQHNEATIDTRSDIEFPRALFSADVYAAFDDSITAFNDLVKAESRSKIMSESTKDIKAVEDEAEIMKK